MFIKYILKSNKPKIFLLTFTLLTSSNLSVDSNMNSDSHAPHIAFCRLSLSGVWRCELQPPVSCNDLIDLSLRLKGGHWNHRFQRLDLDKLEVYGGFGISLYLISASDLKLRAGFTYMFWIQGNLSWSCRIVHGHRHGYGVCGLYTCK